MSADLRPLLRWVARQREGIALELVCAEHPDPRRGDPNRTVIRLGACIQEVGTHEVAELLVAGAESVALRLDGCEVPDTAGLGFAAAIDVLEAAGVHRLTVSGAPDGARRPKRRTVLEVGALPVPRRAVLSLGIGNDVMRELPNQFLAPPKRLNTAIAALVSKAPALAAQVPLINPSGSVQLSAPNCTACQVCVRACPSDALSLAHSGVADATNAGNANAMAFTSLIQDPSACNGCGLCEQMCPEAVLHLGAPWSWDKVREAIDADASDNRVGEPVVTLATARCERCRTRFPTTSGGSLCPVCAFRRANPFSSRIPPSA